MRFAQKSKSTTFQKSGFTLLEIIVSTGIGVVVLGIVLTILQVGGDGYGKTSRRIDTNVEARSALRIFYDDLAAVQFDDYFGVSEASAGQWSTNEIWFMSLMPRTSQEETKASGDLCFVYYYTAVTGPEDQSDVGPFSRKLYRRLISSEDVMGVLKGEIPPGQMGLPEALEQPTPEAAQREQDEAIAFNVIQFLIEPKEILDSGLRSDWQRTVPVDDSDPDDEKPGLVKVTLRVVDTETAGQMRAASDWTAGSAVTTELLGTEEQPGRRLRTFEMTIPCGR